MVFLQGEHHAVTQSKWGNGETERIGQNNKIKTRSNPISKPRSKSKNNFKTRSKSKINFKTRSKSKINLKTPIKIQKQNQNLDQNPKTISKPDQIQSQNPDQFPRSILSRPSTYIIHEHSPAFHALNARASRVRVPARLADQVLVSLSIAGRAHRIAPQAPHRDHASLRALDDELQSARRHRGLEHLRGGRQHVRQRQLGTDRQKRVVAEDLAIVARQQQLEVLLLLLRAAAELGDAVAESEELG